MTRVQVEKSKPGDAEPLELLSSLRGLALLLFSLVFFAAPAAAQAPLPPGAPAASAPSPNRLDLARDRIAAQRFGEAIPLLEAELREHPDNDDARLTLARVLSWQRSYDQSLAEYRQLLERHPQDASIRASYARVLAWSGRHDEAAREFRVAIQADSTNLETRVGYARVLSWGGDLPGAAMEYERILDANPGLGDAWLGLASVARWRGAPTASDRFLERADRLGADDAALVEERSAVRSALKTSIGAGWSSSHERQYVDGPDFTLETDGPYTQLRGTAGRSTGVVARAAWLDLNETPSSGGTPNYDVACDQVRLDLSFLRDYPWQLALGAEYRKFRQGDEVSSYPLGGKENFFGWGGRLWKFTGRFTPFVTARRDYVGIKETAPDSIFTPGWVDHFETGLSWQWSGRGTADASASRGFYSDENRRWGLGGGASYRVKTRVPSITLDGRLALRDWDFTSASYFTPQHSLRGSAGAAVAGYSERAALDYGFRYEFSGLGSSNFDDIWAHSWTGYLNATVADRVPLGLEASYTVDNNSYETWFLGLSAAARW